MWFSEKRGFRHWKSPGLASWSTNGAGAEEFGGRIGGEVGLCSTEGIVSTAPWRPSGFRDLTREFSGDSV